MALYERIDLIFASEPPKKIKAKVVGKSKKDKTPSKLWPSDHAGVVATLKLTNQSVTTLQVPEEVSGLACSRFTTLDAGVEP